MTKDDQKQYLILKDKNIVKGLVILAIPLMLNNFLKTFHDIIDMFFVGRIAGEGTNAVAAIQLTFPVVFTFLALGMGMSMAGTALISQFLGSNHKEDASKYASQLLVLALALGSILMIVSFFGAPLIIKTMGLDAVGAHQFVYENSVAYLRIRAFELPILFMFFSFLATRQASGDTLTPVLVSGTAIVLNTVLSPLFITVFGLGVPGAAYATLLSNALIMPYGFYRLFFAKSGVTVRLANMRLESGVVRDILRTAIPASLGQSITAIGFYIMNGIIYSYGPETVAAFGVGNRLMSIILHPVMAIGGVLAAYIGQNIGAHNPERAKRTFLQAMGLSTAVMAVGSLMLMFVRIPLAGLFLVDDPHALRLAGDYMFYILLGLPLMAVFQTFIGTYNGTGRTQYTFILSVTRLWALRIPIVLYMREFTNLGSSGVWYAMLASNLIIAVLGYILYLRLDFTPKLSLGDEVSSDLALKAT